MPDPNEMNEILDTLAKVLLRCFVLGILLLLFFLVPYISIRLVLKKRTT